MAPTIILITGANRGIGRAMLELYLARPNHVVIAANRNLEHPTSRALADLPRGTGTRLVLVRIDSTSATDQAAAAGELRTRHGVDRVDIVVANAGIALRYPKVSEVRTDDFLRHVEVNDCGFIRLYQAFLPLLRASDNPKWVTIGSASAFLTVSGNFIPIQNAAYAPSKLVQHWLTKAISVEEPWLTAFPIDPGWVQTDMETAVPTLSARKKADLPIEESVPGVVKVIDASTPTTHSGKPVEMDAGGGALVNI